MKMEKGITLIALIITIILMLILAAVVINVTVGENGLFKTAKKAAMDYKISEILEKLEVEKANLIADMNGDIPSVAEYINYLIGKDIITEADVTHIDDNTKEIVVDKYMFLVEKEESGNIKITYNGIATTDPRIGKIEIVKTTINSISIKVIASNVDNGDYKYYIKNITTGEEYSIKPTETLKTNEYEFTGLIKENKYKIKVELVNEKGKAQKETEEIETVPTRVNSITLNKTSIELVKGETDTSVVATVLPVDATDKSLTWTSSDESIAKVSVSGDTVTITALKAGNTNITATANDGSNESASCKVTVTPPPPPELGGTGTTHTAKKIPDDWGWPQLGEIAKEISNNYGNQAGQINEDTAEVAVSYGGIETTIGIGDWTFVNEKKVRILGFNHDNLVTTTTNETGETVTWAQYGEGTTNEKAGISFEYVDALTTIGKNSWTGSSGGWKNSKFREILSSSTILNSLENKEQIKQVIKKYIPTYNVASTNNSNDYLWLLAASEIWNNGVGNGEYASAITGEGKRYKFYEINVGNTKSYLNSEVLKWSGGNGSEIKWLRSTGEYNGQFCYVKQNR